MRAVIRKLLCSGIVDLNHQDPVMRRNSPSNFRNGKLYSRHLKDIFNTMEIPVFCVHQECFWMNELECAEVPLRLQFCVLALMASEHFASLAQASMLSTYDQISLLYIQCNLILCIHWTVHGDEHRAWLQLGVATRIAQSLRLPFEDSLSQDDVALTEIKLQPSPIQYGGPKLFGTPFTFGFPLMSGRAMTCDISSNLNVRKLASSGILDQGPSNRLRAKLTSQQEHNVYQRYQHGLSGHALEIAAFWTIS
ncbi:hypothetical protein WAI453_012250 [Rhynchosporium graminicola]